MNKCTSNAEEYLTVSYIALIKKPCIARNLELVDKGDGSVGKTERYLIYYKILHAE
jgi:hypothetical protein